MADPWAFGNDSRQQPYRPPPQPPAEYNPFLDPAPAPPPPPVQPAAMYGGGGTPPQGGGSFGYGRPAPSRPPPAPMPVPMPAQARASSNNPFDDVDNDDDLDAFFSSSAAPAAAAKGPGSEYKPPTVEQQRLCRSASNLFERGLLIKADKNLLQDLILSGENTAVVALETAEREGSLKQLQQVLLKARSAPQTGERSSVGGERRGGGGGGDDSDEDEQSELMGDSSRRGSQAATATPFDAGGTEAPHPQAGGYTSALPQGMTVSNGVFSGSMMMRISSKKMFRKWKPVFFTLDRRALSIYEVKRDYESGQAPRVTFPMHCCMWVAKPTLKKTYSLIDDGRRVYFSTLKENSMDAVMAAETSGMDRPVVFSPTLESHVVAKFGSHFPNEISAIAHGLYSVIMFHQKEAKKNKTPRSQGRNM